MENTNHEYITDSKDIKVDDDIIAVCATNAILKTPGVSGLSGGITNQISKTIRGKDILLKGMKVTQEKNGVSVNVHLFVDFGYLIPEVAWNAQRNVKKEIESITGKSVRAVNINVEGVREEQKR